MTAGARRRGGRAVRTRLVLMVVGVVTLAAVALSVVAFTLVSRSLRAEVLDRAVEEARFVVEVLAVERLGERVAPGDIEASGLADDLQRRGSDVYVDLGSGDDFVSGLEVVNAPQVVSRTVLDLIAAGNVAAEWLELDTGPHLVVAARRPPAGPDFYFLTGVDDVDDALAQLRVVLIGASLLLMAMGAVAGWRVARLAGSLSDTVDELTAARDRERRFVADVSHELRTPVTALVNESAELTRDIDAVPAGTRRVVELLDHDVRRLRDLVAELLELSRLDAADADADIEIDRTEVARFLETIVAHRLPAATVRAPGGTQVGTDRRRLERIVANLVDNARVHGASQAVTVEARLEGSVLVIEVADRGPGVAAADLDRIFDRFTKADAARAGGGNGLGLAIVREHARLLGATVTARTRERGGLAVEVRVPVETVTEL